MSLGDWLILAASLPAFFFALALVALVRTIRTVTLLSDVEVEPGDALSVTVLTPACDEEAAIEATVVSFLAQQNVRVDVVAIDDRSRDRTGQILDELATHEDRLTVLHVDALPDGWLGKVHALELGTGVARGDWLLFADADVRLEPLTLCRAVAYAEARGLDLVSAYPEIESAGFFGDIAWNFIGCVAGLGIAPWKLRDPDSSHAFSVGAFVLIRREAFQRTPGLSYIRLEVADDMGLSILMKDHGFRCDVVNGRGQVRLLWYTSLRDMVVRSQKNFFGIMSRFSLLRGVAISIGLAWVSLLPALFAVPASNPAVFVAPALVLSCLLGTAVLHAHWAGRPILPGLLAPVGAAILAFTVLRAAILGVRIGGIEWRGVLYESAMLRGVQRFKM